MSNDLSNHRKLRHLFGALSCIVALLPALSAAARPISARVSPATPTPPPTAAASQSEHASIIEPQLAQTLTDEGKSDFWIEFSEHADLSPAYAMSWEDRGPFVYNALRATADRSQAKTRAHLEQEGITYTSHWAVNALYVEGGTPPLVQVLGAQEGIQRIRMPETFPVPEPVERTTVRFAPTGLTAQPNLALIHAPEVWASYTQGEGVVVASIDTGVRYTHAALVAQYRGTSSGSHDYNWYDPQGSTAPFDDNAHGTHTMGIMVGTNDIGVAPGATWIAADGCDGSDCTEEDLVSSGEWLLAPCPLAVAPGSPSCDPAMRPNIVNNSWGDCATTTTDFFEDVIDAWKAAGIFTVFSVGNTSNCRYNSGPFCGSVGNPARHYQVTSVGATDNSGTLAYFSLWGPTDDPDPRLAEFGTIKPELTAPGVSITSAINDSDSAYGSMSGTSMAAPHVAGAAALLLSAKPALVGQTDMIEDILKESAIARPYSTACSGEGESSVPNHAYGWGQLDALQAVETAITPPQLSIAKTAATHALAGVPFVYTLTVTNTQGVASDIHVRDRLPTSATFVTASNGGVLVGEEVLWEGGVLKSGGSLTLTFSVTTPCSTVGTVLLNQTLQVTATEWVTPITGLPVSTTVITPTITADFAAVTPLLRKVAGRFHNLSQNATFAAWEFGDGATSTEFEPYHTYAATGSYTVVLTATGPCGQQATISQPVTVKEGLFLPLIHH